MITHNSFHHAGSEYDIRCSSDGHTVSIQAYKGDQPANGYKYTVTIPTAFDLMTVRGEDATVVLIECAKRDIVEGTWEKLLKAMA